MQVIRSLAAVLSLVSLMATFAKADPIGLGGGNSLGNIFFGATLSSVSPSGGYTSDSPSGGYGGFSTPSTPTQTISNRSLSMPFLAVLPSPQPAPPAVVNAAPVAMTAAPVAVTAAPAAVTAAPVANGFINFGSGPYPDAGSIASGSPQPWYTSPQVAALFGGAPNAAQQAAFTSTVLQLTEQTFQLSGINVNLTTDPNVTAAHTLSVVSGTSSIPFPSSIGTTNVGGNGFSFIDQEATISSSVGQLEQIVAHNVAHELMLAFGVPEQYDQTGNYLDSTTANWSKMISPTYIFSPSAALAINQALQEAGSSASPSPFAQYASPQPVPEPTTLLAWGLGALALAAGRRARSKRLPAR